MQMQEIRVIAKDSGIKTSRLSKIQLVQEIQRHEGNFTCFGSAMTGECDQMGCLWRQDCFAEARKAAKKLS